MLIKSFVKDQVIHSANFLISHDGQLFVGSLEIDTKNHFTSSYFVTVINSGPKKTPLTPSILK